MNSTVRCFLLVLAATWGLPAMSATLSVNGSSVPALPSIIDAQANTWTIASGVVEKNGVAVGSNSNANLLVSLDGVFYERNSSNNWYRWTGSAWSSAGDPRVVSASGTSIGVGTDVLVDSGDHIWTLQTNDYAYRDGIRAAGNYNTILVLYHNNVVYSENTSGEWYSWTGSAWTNVSGDPRGPNLVQYGSYTSPPCPANNSTCVPPFVGNSSVTFARATTKGNAIWVAVTVSDYAEVHAITVTDSQNNTYHALNQENDKAPGAQTVAQFYAASIQGGSDTVTVNWSSDNYKGVLAAEIAGITASPLAGNVGAIQDGKIPSVSENVSSPVLSIGGAKTPALLVALTMDTDGGGSDTGGTGYCAIPAGVGFNQVAQLWSWSAGGQPVCNLATFETKILTASGSVAGLFTTSHLSDPYITVSAVFH
ncbi:MAG: hypothetical protein JWN43_487 [Gammaproteobacteria bacterium]|nr:hypothetical protein [Gammaproteobacteria bacterium]